MLCRSKIVLGLIGMIASFGVLAATAYWDAPTKREDGTKLLKAELKGYEIQYWQVGVAEGTKKSITVLGGGTYKATVPLDVGKNYQVQIAAVDLQGVYSKWAIFPASGVTNNGSSSVAVSSAAKTSSSTSSVNPGSTTPVSPSNTVIQCFPRP